MNKLIILLPFLVGCVELHQDRHSANKLSIVWANDDIMLQYADEVRQAAHVWDPTLANIASVDELMIRQQLELSELRQIKVINTEITGLAVAEYAQASDTIYVDMDLWNYKSRECVVNSIAHELGHAMGLHHVNGQESIMYASQLNC